jgi:three-Cys-motif partner protein
VGDLIQGDDGLPAELVGPWAKEKHALLCRYIDISRGVRKKFLGPGTAGATYIDLFCGPGRAKVKDADFIDGSCVAAWKKSVERGSPFSKVYIADRDEERLRAAAARLEALGAPIEAFVGPAAETVHHIVNRLSPYGLHFAFIDPFSLGAMDFQIFKALARRKRMDIMVHLSKMDLQRNLDLNLNTAASAFDAFAPGWREVIDVEQAQQGIRNEVIVYWRDLVSRIGIDASTEMRLLKGARNQHLYWLLIVASHRLAHAFWKTASNPEKQGSLL